MKITPLFFAFFVRALFIGTIMTASPLSVNIQKCETIIKVRNSILYSKIKEMCNTDRFGYY